MPAQHLNQVQEPLRISPWQVPVVHLSPAPVQNRNSKAAWVLHRSWNVDHIPRPKKENRLPHVLSCSELDLLFEIITNMKHRVIFKNAYEGGLRVVEVSRLKVSDINSGRMVIRIDQGRGNKER